MSDKPTRIKHQGRIYVRADLAKAEMRTAQLQQLLGQYESESAKVMQAIGGLDKEGIKKSLENAHKSLMGKKAEPAIKTLQELKGGLETLTNAVDELVDIANTIAGHLGMSGE